MISRMKSTTASKGELGFSLLLTVLNSIMQHSPIFVDVSSKSIAYTILCSDSGVSTEINSRDCFRSLTGQKTLLNEQVLAKEGLQNLKQLQESAFEENRATVLAFTQEAKLHQQEFLEWQTKLQTMHEQLKSGSNAMLEAQVTKAIKSILFAPLFLINLSRG